MMPESIGDWLPLTMLGFLLVIWIKTRHWRFFSQWLGGIRGRDWPAIPAVVDIVTVIRQTEQSDTGEYTVGYLATLTHFYRSPELQVGEYSRMFSEEQNAEAWSASYKGKTVKVRIDPNDPTRSVLRKEEL